MSASYPRSRTSAVATLYACDLPVVFDPPLTRQLSHSVYSSTVAPTRAHNALAVALRTGTWHPLTEYGIYPLWMFLVADVDPCRVVEYRSGVVLLHVFESVTAREQYLSSMDHDLIRTPVPTVRRRHRQDAAHPSFFSVGAHAMVGIV